MLTSPFVSSYKTFTCFGYPWKKWICMHIAYTRTDIIMCTHARVFGAPDIITIWVWIKPHHSASIPSPFTNKRIIWWDTIRCTESRSNEFFEWSKLKSSTSKQHHLSARSESQAHILARQHVNLDSVWWVEKTDDNNRESHHRDDDATGGLHLTPKWYDLRLPVP